MKYEMAIMLGFVRGIILTGLGATCLSGQERGVAPEEDEDKTGRMAWIITTSMAEGVKSPVKVLAGREITEINLFKRAVGKPVKVPQDGLIHLVNPITDKDGKLSYERYASAGIPEGVKQALIVLSPVPNLKPPLKFRSKVIDLDKFSGGDAMFINLTRMEIGVTVGSGQKVIKSGQLEIINSDKFSGTKNMNLSYHYRLSKQAPWTLISASTAAFRSQRREILIFSYNEKLDQIDYHGISFEALP